MAIIYNKTSLINELDINQGMLTADLNWNSIVKRTNSSVFDVRSPLIILLWFETVLAVIIYGFGLLGNLFSLIVFYSQREFLKVSTGLLFTLMILFNTIHLWTLCTDFLITYSVYLYGHVFFQCRLQIFVLNVSRAMSSYLAMSVALDRFIRSEMPMRSKVICTRRNVYKVTIIYLIIFCILLSFFFCPLNSQDPQTRACVSRNVPIYSSFIQNIFFPSRAAITCIVPIGIMSIANIRVLNNIRRSRHRVTQQGTILNSVWSMNTIGTDTQTTRSMTALDRALALMTAINVFTFTITQIPLHTYIVVRVYVSTLDSYTHTLVRAMLLIWSSLYFGVGFYLYCLTTPLFRKKSIKIAKKIIHRVGRTLFCSI